MMKTLLSSLLSMVCIAALAGQTLTVVLSQLTCEERWASTLHNQTSLQLKLQLNHRRNVSCISVPYIS